MRNSRDCQYMTAAIITNNDTALALLFGLLCGEYLKAPDAVFWDVTAKFLCSRSGGTV